MKPSYAQYEPPAPASSGSISCTVCTISPGQSTCPTTVSWTSNNASSVKIYANGFQLSWPPFSGSQSYPLSDTPVNFYEATDGPGGSGNASTTCTANPAAFGAGWWQLTGLDGRIDSGINDPIAPTSACGQYASNPGSGTTTGVIFSGGIAANYGTNLTTPQSLQVGNSSFPENLNIPQGKLKTSYSIIRETFLQNGGNIFPPAQIGYSGSGPLSLPAAVPAGKYDIAGDLNINQSITFSGGNYVFFVNGNVNINNAGTKILVAPGSTLTVIASGNILIGIAIGSAPSCPPFTSVAADYTTGDIEGFFSADQQIHIISHGTNGSNCAAGQPDTMVKLQGSFIAGAARTGGTFRNDRTLCVGNNLFPTVSVRERPDLILNMPAVLRQSFTVAQEVAP